MSEQIDPSAQNNKNQRHSRARARREAQAATEAVQAAQDRDSARIQDVRQNTSELVDNIDMLLIEVLGSEAIKAS